MEDYGFEYSDDDYAEEDVDIENQYYNSKGHLESDELSPALEGFLELLSMEEEPGEWGFKALKQIVKLYYRMDKREEMLHSYTKMLEYANTSAVTRNAAEKKINSTLEFIGHSTDHTLLHEFYSLTLQGLADAKNARLWFKTSIKLANLWVSLGQEEKALGVLEELKDTCKDEQGKDDLKKGTQLLEVYALQIQLLSDNLIQSSQKGSSMKSSSSKTANRRELLEQTYEKALAIKSAIPHPKIMGIIREYGGKMHMNSRNWEDAATDFFGAFKSYDEAGSMHRIKCLKYLVLANMMMESSVDPFDSQEARPYRLDPSISAMTSLVEAYQASNIQSFEDAVSHGDISGDSFIAPYIADLRRKLCSKVIITSITPYSRIKIESVRMFVASSSAFIDVDELILSLILDRKIPGKINQVANVLEIERPMDAKDAKLEALKSWADNLQANNARIAEGLAI